MDRIKKICGQIKPIDKEVKLIVKQRLDNLTKPLGSLGRLEEIAQTIAGIRGEIAPRVCKKVVIVMVGDHGVVSSGVSAYPQEVTTQMVYNFLNGGAAINVLARHANSEVRIIDIGMRQNIDDPALLDRNIRRGTANFLKEPTMSREEAIRSVLTGFELACEEVREGADLIATGEMGIGNTTPSAAVFAAICSYPASKVVGRGTGLDNKGVEQKCQVVEAALKLHRPNPYDPIDVLSKVGGLEIGGLAGCILGAASTGCPVVLDGFISGAAALLALHLCPQVHSYLIASHISREQGHKLMLEELNLVPLLNMNMCLGEGTGAVLAMNLIEASCKILGEMATFDEAGVAGPEKNRLNKKGA